MLEPAGALPRPIRNWYALRTKPRHEKVAAAQLDAKGFEAYAPGLRTRRRWSDRWVTKELPLFEGYIFGNFHAQEIGMVRAARGVLYVLPVGEPPAPVPLTELESLRRVVEECGEINPIDRLEPGDLVEVIQGPLEGVIGTLVRRQGKTRLIVSIGILGRGVETQIHVDQIKPLDDSLGHPLPRSSAHPA